LYKSSYKRLIQDHVQKTRTAVTKEVFLKTLAKVIPLAFTPTTVQAAFRCTGLHPVDRNVIPADEVAPSEETSLRPVFPLPSNPVVNAVLPYIQQLMENKPQPTGPSFPSSHPERGIPPTAAPTIQIDPALLVSEVCVNTVPVSEALEDTPGHNCVTQRSWIPSEHPIPPPLLPPLPATPETTRIALATAPASSPRSLACENAMLREALEDERTRLSAQNRIIVTQKTTTVLQHMTLSEQNNRLHAKEHRKQSRKGKLLSTKHGRHLTGTQFRDAARMDDADAEQEKIKKQARKTARERKRKAREWRIGATERRRQQRNTDIEMWENDNRNRIAGGQRENKKRPRMPPRENTPEEFAEQIESEGEDLGEEAAEDDEGDCVD
jgi:hypothetical protein